MTERETVLEQVREDARSEGQPQAASFPGFSSTAARDGAWLQTSHESFQNILCRAPGWPVRSVSDSRLRLSHDLRVVRRSPRQAPHLESLSLSLPLPSAPTC